MQALHEKTGGPVADTGTSALLGALCDPAVLERSFRQGLTIVNVGNGHTVAALLYQGKVRGIYEHHTGMRTREQLLEDLEPGDYVMVHAGVAGQRRARHGLRARL